LSTAEATCRTSYSAAPADRRSQWREDGRGRHKNAAGLQDHVAVDCTADEDEIKRWKRSEPAAERGTEQADNPIKYWVSIRDCYPSFSKLTFDVLSIPASSCECERLFSKLGNLLEPRRRRLGPQLLAAIQCVRRWQRAGLGGEDEVMEEEAADDDNIELLCGLAT
jgi:hypothetical protein